MSQGRRRLAAIMYTDIVGYTSLGQINESLSLTLVENQRKLIRPILVKHQGREIKTMGDAFLVEFPSALEAVKCAYDIQTTSREFNTSQPANNKIRLRVGLHVGDVVESEGDILGDAVNVASRIQPLAEEGGISLSRQVYDQVANKFELPIASLGIKTLKNVRNPQEVFTISLPWNEEQASKEQLDKRRIAVLPFTNMSPDQSDEFFADGLTEEMITELSRDSHLHVIGRTSAMLYKNAHKSLREIGRELGVGSLLEGSVRKSANRLRITAQLIDTRTEEHLWAEKFDRDIGDIFTIQTDIASNVAHALQIRLVEPIGGKQKGDNIEAYTLYLKGRFLWNRRTVQSIREALMLFQAITARYPEYAKAYSGIADCYIALINRSDTPWSETGPGARNAAEKALALDEDLAEAHASLGMALNNEMDYAGAEMEIRKSIELNPGYPTGHHWYGLLLLSLGRLQEAHAEMEKAEEADPFSPIILGTSGYLSWLMGNEDKAVQKWNRVLEVDPGAEGIHVNKAEYYTWKGMKAEALAELEQTKSFDEKERETLFAETKAWLGDRRDAELLLNRFQEKKDKSGRDMNRIAWLYAAIGDVDKFYDYAMKAADERCFFPEVLRGSPLLAKARENPRYYDFLKKWKVPP